MRASLDLREATQTPPTRLCQPGNKSCVVVSEMVSGSVYALLAGFLAAAASLSAKLTVGADYLRDMCESGLSRWDEARDGSTVCDWALRHCSSSARATVTTTASNFISSGILGRFMFGETHSSLWWTGMSLTLCGLLVLHASTPQSPTQEGGQKDK
ncbi:transmembrane protein 42 isoform X2 [Austrofundulus limnaeus]|uniref:Transmembrane protein 42 isoform X2 n=1 Tax=Austrofundulus limnaeus TaxID=52670 RepID=A0A2I4D747_AUSLI|nr:PREDICTED: transmembrane protein 42 isoform X2 [Austrofundulus limnaeus]